MAKNPNLKRAFEESEYSPQQIMELKKCTTDPIYFMENYIKVSHPTKGAVPFVLYEYQKEMVTAIHENKDTMLLCSRQMGKCVFADTKVTVKKPQNKLREVFGMSQYEMTIEDLFENSNPEETQINDQNGNLKFISEGRTDLLVKTPSGWSNIKRVLKTVKYEAYQLSINGFESLVAADDHIIMTENGETFMKDLKINDLVHTINGLQPVQSIKRLHQQYHMYDLELDDEDHVYYTNGILSHNTTVAAMYILWFALFNKNKRCVIASKAMAHAVEIQSRIKYAYEELPHWLKAGCKFYNRTSIEFDNESKIICEATSEKTGRGSSPSIIFLDEIAFISRRIQDEMWASLTPALSTGGKFIITSTPNGDSDLFATLWREAKSGTNSFKALEFLWYMHPDRDKAYYDDMRGKLGELKTRQELDCLNFQEPINTSIGILTMEQLYAHLEQAKSKI